MQVHTLNVRCQMRSGTMVIVVVTQVLTGCFNSNSKAAQTPVSSHEPAVECLIIDDKTNPRRCSNLLDSTWQTGTGSALQKLADDVQKMLPAGGEVQQSRLESADCRGGKPRDLRVKVGYQVPAAAMAVFPTTGTRGRDLVIGVMDDKQEATCWSARYSVQGKMGAASNVRVLTFLTVSTDSAGHIPGVNRQVGRWTSWTITKRAGSYELVSTGVGAFVSCGHPHYTSPESSKVTHAFINCERVTILASLAARKANTKDRSAIAAEFDRLLLAYRDGKRVEGFDDTARFLETDSAWSRCGNLGCCAAE